MGAQLFTIGYEGADLETFLRCLQTNRIECLLDVREIPLSRKRGFSKGALSAALAERGILYVHLKALGSPRSLREELKVRGDYAKFFRGMNEHLAEQQQPIEQACDFVGRMRCCLMCLEKLAATCHRKLVARKIKERDGNGLEVQHLRLD
jgi:uncharacterized protein (DUF488 family)